MQTVFIVLREWADCEGSGSDIWGTYSSSESAKKNLTKAIKNYYDGDVFENEPDFLEDHLINDGFGFIDEDDPEFIQRFFIVENEVED